MRPGSRNKGATLLQVVIYCGILTLLLGGVYFVVEGGMRYMRLAEVGETVNQQAVIGMRKAIHQLSPASQQAFEFDLVNEDYVTFLSPESPRDDPPGYSFNAGDMEWIKWVSMFLDEDRLVSVEEVLGAPVTDPATVVLPDFAGDVLGWPGRYALASNVAEVNFTNPAPAVVRVRILTSEETGTNRTTDLELVSSVRLLNE